MIDATLAGDVDTIRREIPNWDSQSVQVESEDDDDFSFLTQDKSAAQESFISQIRDERGYQLLDLICEAVVGARLRGLSSQHLAPVTLELLVNKGAYAGEATVRMLFSAEEFESFVSFARKVQCFRRTIGMFGLAAFGFDPLGQTRVLTSQGWAVRRLYGVASIIHGDMVSSNIAGICSKMHPSFLRLLEKDVHHKGAPTMLRAFAQRMAGNDSMMNSIRDNHAHRFLTTYLKTPAFEEDVLRFARQARNEMPDGSLKADLSLVEGEPNLKQFIEHTILLADDNDEQRLKISGWLISRGYKVIEARDGTDALVLFDRHRSAVELILSDFGMPEMDGFNLAANIRERDPDIPMIINTTPPIHPDLSQEANRLGVSLIRKFDEGLLLGTIRFALDGY